MKVETLQKRWSLAVVKGTRNFELSSKKGEQKDRKKKKRKKAKDEAAKDSGAVVGGWVSDKKRMLLSIAFTLQCFQAANEESVKVQSSAIQQRRIKRTSINISSSSKHHYFYRYIGDDDHLSFLLQTHSAYNSSSSFASLRQHCKANGILAALFSFSFSTSALQQQHNNNNKHIKYRPAAVVVVVVVVMAVLPLNAKRAPQ